MKHDFCRFLRREACSVVGGLFAVQCRAEGRWMVPKLGIKGGERWAGRIQHQLPLLLLLLLRAVEEVMARSESSSADVTCQSYTITVICCSSHPRVLWQPSQR